MGSAAYQTSPGLQDVSDANVITTGQIYKSNVNVTLVDPGAIAWGGELASQGIAAANEAVDGIVDVVGDMFTHQAQEADRNRSLVAGAAKYAVDFAASESQQNREFLAGATKAVIDFATGETEQSRAFAGQAAQAAIDSAAGAFSGALSTVNGALDKVFTAVGGAFTSLDKSQTNALKAVTENSIVNMQFIDAQSKRLADNATATLNGITTFVADLFGQTDARNASVISQIAQQSGDNIKAVGEATRSDAAKSLDKVMIVAAVAVVVIGGVALIARGR